MTQTQVATPTLSLATISKAPTLGFLDAMSGVQIAKSADSIIKTMRGESLDAPMKAIYQLHILGDYAPHVIAAIEQSGQELSANAICDATGLDPAVFGIEDDMVKGQQLGMLLSNAHLVYMQYENNKNYLLEAQQIYDRWAREDYKLAGYNRWYLMMDANQRVGGMSRTRATNRLNLIRFVKPRLDAIGWNITQLFRSVDQTTADALVPLLGESETLDNDGLRVVCALIEDGQITSKGDVESLRNNPAIRVWSKFAEQLRNAGLDPVEHALTLGLEKLGPVAQFVTSGTFQAELGNGVAADGSPIDGFIVQMEKIDLAFVVDECKTPHSASHDHTATVETFDDDDDEPTPVTAKQPAQTIKGAEIVQLDENVLAGMLTTGAQDAHTKLVMKIIENDAEGGYVKVQSQMTVPVLLLQKLLASGDCQLVDDKGVEHIVRSGVVVKKK